MNIDGQRIRHLREAKVLSLSMLAKQSGVSRETILAIEQGKRDPHPTTIHKLAEALGVDPDDLFKRDEDFWQARLAAAGWRLQGQRNAPDGSGAIWGVIPLHGAKVARHEVFGADASDAIEKFLDTLKKEQ